jgi:hypothetical protein
MLTYDYSFTGMDLTTENNIHYKYCWGIQGISIEKSGRA